MRWLCAFVLVALCVQGHPTEVSDLGSTEASEAVGETGDLGDTETTVLAYTQSVKALAKMRKEVAMLKRRKALIDRTHVKQMYSEAVEGVHDVSKIRDELVGVLAPGPKR